MYTLEQVCNSNVTLFNVHCNRHAMSAFRRQQLFFGACEEEQLYTLEQEKNAYFGLHTPNNILERVNMSPCFYDCTCVADTRVWLQSVTMI